VFPNVYDRAAIAAIISAILWLLWQEHDERGLAIVLLLGVWILWLMSKKARL
jgi:hypothetical protein